MESINKYEVEVRVATESIFSLIEQLTKLFESICTISFLFSFGAYAMNENIKLVVGCLIVAVISLIILITSALIFVRKTRENIDIYISDNELELEFKGEKFKIDLLQVKKHIIIDNDDLTATLRQVRHNNNSYRIIISNNDSEKLKSLVLDLM